MKKTIKKIVALICTAALLVSMCTFVTAFAAADVNIITAQFLPYEGQIKVLASLADGYSNAEVYVNGTKIDVTSQTRSDGEVVFTSTSFAPTSYGVATVELRATIGGTICSDTQNIKIYKVLSATSALTEDFNEIECAEMTDIKDGTVSELLAASSAVKSLNFPDVDGDKVNNKAIVSIANRSAAATDDNALYFNIPSTVTSGLPGLIVAPSKTTASGTVEISFDVFGNKSKSRASMYIYAPNRKRYVFTSLAYKNASDNGAYYAVCHDESTFARTEVEFITNTWHKVRFLLNIDEYTYQYYVNDELLDYGTLSNLDSTACNGFGSFEMQIGCGNDDSLIAIDNIAINYIDFAPVSYAKDSDVTSNLSFDASSDSDTIAITAQSGTTVNKKSERIAGETALSFYYTEPTTSTATLKGKKTFFAIHNLSEKIAGRIVIEHDLYITDANATLNYELNDKTSSGKLTFYPLQDNSLFAGGKISTKTCDYSDGWNNVRIVLDFPNGWTEVYFDNELINKSNYLLAGTTAGAGSSVTSFQSVRINYSPSTEPTLGQETFGFAIDNWRVYQELPVPEIKSVEAYDISGNSAALAQTYVISADNTDKFEIALSNTEYLNKASLEANAKVLADGVEVQDTVSLSDGTLTVDVSNVPAHADLELVIGKDTLLYDGTTTIGADTVYNLKTANENGLYIKRAVDTAGEALSADCDLDIVSGSKNVVAVFASYNNDDELVGITSRTVTLAGAKSLSMTLPKSNATKVKVFVWDGLASSVTPYETELSYSIPAQN